MPIQTPICDFGQKAVPFELKSTDKSINLLENLEYKTFDKDGNGKISAKELKAVLGSNCLIKVIYIY